MPFKNFSCKVEDLSTSSNKKQGKVKIYVNAFNNKDSDGEISNPGSFKKTISEGIDRIRHLYNHDLKMLIGYPEEMIEDHHGLLTVSNMNLQKQWVADVYSDYEFFAEGNKTLEHSIGYEIMKWHETEKNRIMEYKLYEYSTLAFWGSNELTHLVELKSYNDIMMEIDHITEAIKKGKYSDTKFKNLEKKIKLLQEQLTLKKQPSDDTQEVEPSKLLDNFSNLLNL